jgi:hypothetical protein
LEAAHPLANELYLDVKKRRQTFPPWFFFFRFRF